MAGGAWEYVAGYLANGTNTPNLELFKNLPGAEKQEYLGTGDTSDEGRKANFQANSAKYGDALWETARDDAGASWRENVETEYNVAWNGDYSYFPYVSSPFFLRGGNFTYSAGAGVFSFYYGVGGPSGFFGFRPVVGV